ncbi:MAG: formate dehydrogenase, partial [Burkholderiales bacterium]
MSTTVYVPCDSSALSLGAEKTAQAIATEAARRGADIKLVRNGSRGLFWLEPMVEVETPAGRVAYGPVQPKDVASLFEAGFLTGGKHALSLGLTEEIAYLKNQERLTAARVGLGDPLCLDTYA